MYILDSSTHLPVHRNGGIWPGLCRAFYLVQVARIWAPCPVACLAEMVRQKPLAEAYFVAATAAIDAVFAWIESCGAEIRRELGAVGAGEAVELSEPTAKLSSS